jgi:nitric oxide reductase NorE protein
MDTPTINQKNVYYPPGGILMWIIIFLELFTFGIALIFMTISGRQEPEVFHASRILLNPTYGAINTIFLLTSGLFMARTVQLLNEKNIHRASFFLKLTMLGGVLFLTLKGLEYWDKIEAGLILSYNTFFTYYWMLTLFHVVHVVVGLIILWTVQHSMSKNPQKLELEDVEASAAFWHMCDLIWLLLFPIIYLIF